MMYQYIVTRGRGASCKQSNSNVPEVADVEEAQDTRHDNCCRQEGRRCLPSIFVCTVTISIVTVGAFGCFIQ